MQTGSTSCLFEVHSQVVSPLCRLSDSQSCLHTRFHGLWQVGQRLIVSEAQVIAAAPTLGVDNPASDPLARGPCNLENRSVVKLNDAAGVRFDWRKASKSGTLLTVVHNRDASEPELARWFKKGRDPLEANLLAGACPSFEPMGFFWQTPIRCTCAGLITNLNILCREKC